MRAQLVEFPRVKARTFTAKTAPATGIAERSRWMQRHFHLPIFVILTN
jgi:hypothetical protein